MTYDLHRLRARGLITRIPHTHRNKITDHGLHAAIYLSAVHDRFLPTGPAHRSDRLPTATDSLPRIPDRARQPHPHNRSRRMTPSTRPQHTKLDSNPASQVLAELVQDPARHDRVRIHVAAMLEGQHVRVQDLAVADLDRPPDGRIGLPRGAACQQ